MDLEGVDSRFHTTLWSVVLRAGNGDEIPKQSALDHLCHLYWKPLFVYCLGQGRSREDAEDLTQGFFAYLLAKDSLRVADPDRGRFRSFLLTSFKHYIAGEGDRCRAARRGAGAVHLSFDVDFNESNLCPSATSAPEIAYDRQWALDLVSRATDTLRAEIQTTGKSRWFDLVVGSEVSASYAAAAADLGTTEEAVKSFAKRTRRRFREILEASIADTVGSPDELAGEIAYIASLLRG
jgi:DNA-directed RNA polymerase specialized sigma24 family protein